MVGRFFWAAVSGFLLGIAARSFLPLGHSSVAFFLLLGCAIGALAYVDPPKRRQGILVSCFLFAFALGIVRMDVATLSGDPMLTAHIGTQVTIEGVVSAEPDVRDNSVRVAIATSKIISPVRLSTHAGVLAVLPAHADVYYGEPVHAWGILQAPQAFDTGSGRQFAYPQYLAAQGINYELSLAQAEGVQGAPWAGNPLQAAAIGIKETFLKGVAAALPEPEAGLAGGITVGDKRSIGADLTTQFQNVGLVHVVVLSGYNITVVLSSAAWVLVHLGAPRIVQFGASGFLVCFFILMSGGAGSATRAGLMALVAVLARATGRTFLASRALALAALLIVLWDPFELAFDPSFQLSALATLGLILFSPIFAGYLHWIPEKFALREIASSTLGTQLAVLPILLYQNGNLAIYSLPANLLALVAVPAAMLFSLIAGVSGIILGHFAVPLAFPAYMLLAYIIGVAQFFAAFPFAAISIGAFSAAWMSVAYAILFAGAWFMHIKKIGRAQ